MKSAHVVVTGRVQGVGYRAWCQKTAAAMKISGWVKNRSDGTVELIAVGEEVDAFVALLWKGPMWSKVIGVSREDVESEEEYEGFRILR